MRALGLLLALGCGAATGCGDGDAGGGGGGSGAGALASAAAGTPSAAGTSPQMGEMGGGGGGMPTAPVTTASTGTVPNTGCTLEGPSYPQMGELLLERSGVIGIEPMNDALYFITRNSIERLPPGASEPEALVADVAPQRNTSRAESLLQVDATHVFWVAEDAIWSAPHTPPGAPTMLVDGLDDVTHIRVHGSLLYYATRGMLLARLPLAGGPAEVLLEGDLVTDLQVSDEHIYLASFNRHRAGRMPIDGGDPQWYTPDIDAPAAIAFDVENLYWTSRHSMSATPLSMPGQHTLLGQGTPPRVAAPAVNQMQVQSERLYWLDDSFVIGWVATDGADCGQVARGMDFDLHGGTLYASDEDEGIWRVTL